MSDYKSSPQHLPVVIGVPATNLLSVGIAAPRRLGHERDLIVLQRVDGHGEGGDHQERLVEGAGTFAGAGTYCE